MELISKHVGPVYVLNPVVDEVAEIEGPEDLERYGLIVIDPELEDAFTAGGMAGKTSFQDNLCLLTAKRRGYACVTNDNNLRALCYQEGVDVIWGLQLLAKLHGVGGITGTYAIGVATLIHESNRKYISGKILKEFIRIIQQQA